MGLKRVFQRLSQIIMRVNRGLQSLQRNKEYMARLEKFVRENGYLEVLPVCCDIDYLSAEASHGVLHRDYTLATVGHICDYWIVPDKIANPQ